eukprot:8765349-Pyramimonas_sp.AAC.1
MRRRASKRALALQVKELSARKRAALVDSTGAVDQDVAVATYDGIISIASSKPKHLSDMQELRQLERVERAWRASDKAAKHEEIQKWHLMTGGPT